MENLNAKSATSVRPAPSAGTLALAPPQPRRTKAENRCGLPPHRTPLPKRWQRARAWFNVRGIGGPDMASLKLMLEAENIGAG